jgi:hypothetical protein
MKTTSAVARDVKNNSWKVGRIFALWNVSVKQNPSPERDFKREGEKICV